LTFNILYVNISPEYTFFQKQMAPRKTNASLTIEVEQLTDQLTQLKMQNNALIEKFEAYLPIIEEWNKTKNIQAIEIESIISSAVLSRRVEFTLWLINQPLIVLLVTLAIGITIKYEISTPEDPFSFNSGTTWIIPVIVSGIGVFLSSLSKSYENSQKKGDAMILTDIERSLKPWLKELKDEMVKERLESDARHEKQRQESEARAEKQRQESEARAEKQRTEDNVRIAKIFDLLEKRISEAKN
jgi:hypothetical protein